MIKKEIKNFNLQTIADSGQCFRMEPEGADSCRIIAHNRILRVKDNLDGSFSFDTSEEDFKNIWEEYFDLRTDYSRFIRAIPESDVFLTAAAEYGSGIRILKQEPFETLITFIISQRKNIPAIKKCVEELSLRFGEELSPGIHAFPTPEALSEASVEELNACSLGYRTEYVRRAARRIALGDVSLSELCKLDDAALFDALLSFHGVGKKVANCVMLFAYHRIAAFPVDVWIDRVIKEKYSGAFPLEKYEGFAGVIQQYMFYYGRSAGN